MPSRKKTGKSEKRRPAGQKSFSIIGYTCDAGGKIRGANQGPRVLRSRGLARRLESLGVGVVDLGDSARKLDAAGSAAFRNSTNAGERKLLDLEAVYAAVSSLYGKTAAAIKAGSTPLILGGDHSLSIGSVAAAADHFAESGRSIGLIWVDAHADINTLETTPSRRIFGMAVAILLGLVPGALKGLQRFSPAVKAENVVLIGQRDLDPGERETIRNSAVTALTIKQIDLLGMAEAARRAIAIASAGTAGFVVSFDLDVCDPALVPGTATPTRGGLSYREAHLLLELINDSGKLLSLELVELNPTLDKNFTTAELALSLIETVAGKSVL